MDTPIRNLLDRLRHLDKDIKYITLTAWDTDISKHYHIMININTDIKTLKNILNNYEYNLQEITDQTRLMGYFKKNIVKNTIGVLKQPREKFEDMQVEILEHSKILNMSRNIVKPIVTKDPTKEQLQEVYNKHCYIETKEYSKLNSNITIDKFTINPIETTVINDEDIEW